jgi:hypothetical protein
MSEEADGTAPQFNVDGICHVCTRRRGVWSCEAFDRIPAEILVGAVLHTKPYPGDRGLQFVKKVQ